MKTYLEFRDEKSHKFWELVVESNTHTVTYGKIGAKGRSKIKEFADEAKTMKDAEKLIKSKIKKGYKSPEEFNEANKPQKKVTTNTSGELSNGETIDVQGSGSNIYTIKNVGGVYSCSCPAWRNQSKPIDLRTCKHIIRLRGEKIEQERIKAGENIVLTKKIAKKDGPPLLLAHNYEDSIDPTNWLISEKLDGVRAYWDGKKFISRLGNEFYAPNWFTKGLPDFKLDGELWAGRKQFQKTVSIVRRFDAGDEWKQIKYFVFDAPAQNSEFEQRLQKIDEYFKKNEAPYVEILEQKICKNKKYLQEELEKIIAVGGEGLMLRQAGSLYEVGRSSTLLKLKRFYDAEAKVIKHIAGKGKFKGMLGALRVITPEGVEFSVGTGFTDAERKIPPKIESTITYRYQELTNAGVPRFPSFVR